MYNIGIKLKAKNTLVVPEYEKYSGKVIVKIKYAQSMMSDSPRHPKLAYVILHFLAYHIAIPKNKRWVANNKNIIPKPICELTSSSMTNIRPHTKYRVNMIPNTQ